MFVSVGAFGLSQFVHRWSKFAADELTQHRYMISADCVSYISVKVDCSAWCFNS